jgi:hypothetical protein
MESEFPNDPRSPQDTCSQFVGQPQEENKVTIQKSSEQTFTAAEVAQIFTEALRIAHEIVGAKKQYGLTSQGVEQRSYSGYAPRQSYTPTRQYQSGNYQSQQQQFQTPRPGVSYYAAR